MKVGGLEMARWFAVLACCLALPAGAQASTIVYTSDGDVFIADMTTGNVSAVTKDGSVADPYRSPSQADDGTIVAVRGEADEARLYRFDQAGNRLNAPFETAAPTTGPMEAQVSPDGSTVAFHAATVVDGCGPFYTCPDTRTTIQYSAADHFTEPYARGEAGGFISPSWIDNERTLVFSGGIWIHRLDTDNSTAWVGAYFEGDEEAKFRNIREGDISRDGKRLVAVFNHYQDSTGFLQLFRPDGDLVNEPRQTCRIKAADGSLNGIFSDATWSPDGSQLAWAEADGIHIASIDDTTCAISGFQMLEGQEPDWSGAPYAPPAIAKPTLTKLRVTATKITFTVSELSAAIFKFQRKVGKRFVAVKGKVQAAASEGANTIRWKGKVGGRKLPRGTYRVTGVAVSFSGVRSKPVRVTYVRR